MKTSLLMLFDKLSARTSVTTSTDGWRKVLIRDLEFLLNDASRSADLHLQNYEQCENSVINFGLPSLSQQIPVNTDPLKLARHIQRIIACFEPRLNPKTIRVVPVTDGRQANVLALLFDIYGTCCLPGEETVVSVRIALDYSCGAVHVFD
ncbi:type VI secretion system baseplate subunit TssE [Pseudomonas chlororaphis]|nr:GPW/gp25 family protein [Pseudomonas chlororaphis]